MSKISSYKYSQTGYKDTHSLATALFDSKKPGESKQLPTALDKYNIEYSYN